MRLVADIALAVGAERAQEAFLDPAFYAAMGRLEGISAPELRSLELSPGHARAIVGYRFSGQLNGPARRLLDPSKLTWAQVADVDLVARRTTVTMVPDNYANLLSFSGWYELREEGPGRALQHLEADLRVHLPLLGAVAERALAGSVRQNLSSTARLLETYVGGE